LQEEDFKKLIVSIWKHMDLDCEDSVMKQVADNLSRVKVFYEKVGHGT
jgi:hypothetical protein